MEIAIYMGAEYKARKWSKGLEEKASSKHEVMGRKEWVQVCVLRSDKVEGTARRKRPATNGITDDMDVLKKELGKI